VEPVGYVVRATFEEVKTSPSPPTVDFERVASSAPG
jgi:hypothetical protein